MATSMLINEPGDFGARDVVPGMAHFPGGGPPGKECGDCRFYGMNDKRPKDRLSSHACSKFTEFTGGACIDFDARNKACKYFSQANKTNTKLW